MIIYCIDPPGKCPVCQITNPTLGIGKYPNGSPHTHTQTKSGIGASLVYSYIKSCRPSKKQVLAFSYMIRAINVKSVILLFTEQTYTPPSCRLLVVDNSLTVTKCFSLQALSLKNLNNIFSQKMSLFERLYLYVLLFYYVLLKY